MKKIVLYVGEGEHWAFDASTDELEEQAYLEVFKMVEEKVVQSVLAAEQIRDMAKRGNAQYARAWLELSRKELPGYFKELIVLPIQTRSVNPIKLIKRVPCPEALRDTNLPKAPIQLDPPPPKIENHDRGQQVELPPMGPLNVRL
jgi:hypothetical protein